MPRSMRGLILVAVVLVLMGGLSIYNSNVVHEYQSTFNVLALKYFKIPANLRDQTRITGTYQEASGRPVNFTIMSSIQFAFFQVGQPTQSLYTVRDRPSASIDFTSTVPDTYYLVFTHGTGLLNTNETVYFHRIYASSNDYLLISGAVLVVIGIAEGAWGLSAGRGRKVEPLRYSVDPPRR